MSGRELDPDGTDSYHPEHPWEQTTHPLYLPPDQRTAFNWPPEPAHPHGAHEAQEWGRLPARVPVAPTDLTFGPGYSYPPTRAPRGAAGDSGARRRWWRR